MGEPVVGVPRTGAVAHQVRSLVRPLRERAYALLFAGQACSLLGDQFYVVALPFLVLGRATPRELGVVLAAFGLARAAAVPLGGILADRFSRVRVMLLSDAGRAVCVGLVAVLALSSTRELWPLIVVTALLGALEGLFLPPSFAVLPDILPPEQLAAGNALSMGASNAAVLFGPPLAGVVVALVSPAVAFAIDAPTFLVSAATLLLIGHALRARGGPEPAADAGSDGGARQGFVAFLLSSRILQFALLITLVVNLTYAGMNEVALPVLSRNVFGRGAEGYGAMLAAFGLGALAGALLADAFSRLPHRGGLALGLGVLQGVLVLLVPVVGSVAGAAVLLGGVGVANGILNVFYVASLQQRVPGSLLGRAMSLITLSALGANPVSTLAAGILVAGLGPGPVFLAAGVMISIAFSLGVLSREFRDL